jgi:hypothetical protein
MVKTKGIAKIKKIHSLQWIFEPLETNPEFLQKKMFGCQAGYLNDKLVLVIADGDAPWNGLLIPTEREFHPSLKKEFPDLNPHPVLGKWLYLPQTATDFEEIALRVVESVKAGDSRFGVDPKPKKPKRQIRNKK